MLAGLALGALVLGGCRGAPPPARPPVPGAPVWQLAQGEAGTWRVRWSAPSSPLPFGEPCEVQIEVRRRDGGAPPRDLELRVDAGMPEHGHGSLRRARVQALGGGRFRVEGLYLHMPGAWTLYLDVGSAGVFERSEVALQAD